MRVLFTAVLLMLCLRPVLAGDSLATIDTYYVDFQTEANVGDCRDHLMEDLEDELVKLTTRSEYADAVFVVRIAPKKAGLRDSLHWDAAVFNIDKKMLVEFRDDETGWNLEAACIDAVADIAEALGDEIKDARVNRGRIAPRYKVIEEAPTPVVTPGVTLIAPPTETQPLDDDGSYEMKERSIGEDAPVVQSKPQQPERRMVEGQLKGKATQFARMHGCSTEFTERQSLPSGAEIYTTSCGGAGRAMITCSAKTKCELDF